jgi:hypothetical protein
VSQISSPHSQQPSSEPVDKATDTTSSDLDRFGIKQHQHTTYEWSGFRYTNLSDAIAAAKRAAR